MSTNEQIVQIATEELQSNPLQPRGAIMPESLVELADSIREHGILEPLIVAKTPSGYQIIAGERRWRAAKIAGLTHLPCLVKETTPRGMLEMALVENVQRADLNPLERAKAFQRLNTEFGLGTVEIAKRIGKSPAFISNTLRLLTLPDALKDGLLSSSISEGHARALSQITDQRLMIDAYKIILREQKSVRQAEELARKIAWSSGAKTARSKTATQTMEIVHEEVAQMQADIQRALGGSTAAKVDLSRSRIKTILEVVLLGDLATTEQNLQKLYRGIMREE
jgi:ParB family chromosome partitioning protein